MARLRFLVPSLMCGGILLGTLVAVAHHLFYKSLNGKIVHSDSQQQWFFRIGTGLAFMAKTLLTAAAALGYTQLLWHTLRSRPISLNGVDSLFGAVNNAWHFTNWELWGRGPALAIIALIIWTLPLIAVVTPATLTVQPAAQLNQTTYNASIPSIDYGTPQAQKFALIGQGGPLDYSGPSPRVVRLMSTVSSQGSISQISAPYPNCTYSVPFYGPSLSCGAPNTGDASFQDDVWKLINAVNCDPLGDCTGVNIPYVAFVPQWVPNSTLSAAVLLGLNETLYQANNITTYDEGSNDHMRLYVTVPGLGTNETDEYQASWYDTIECGLYNTSYVLNFTFTNGQQEVTVTNKTQLNGVSNQLSYSICGGGIENGGEPCSGPVLGYMSMIDALGNLLLGFLTLSQYNAIGYPGPRITSTVLMETMNLQSTLKANPDVTGIAEPLSIANMSMSEALEEIVLNATLSLFSDSYFLQNSTAASIRPIIVSTPQNAYAYSPRNLFIAYGLGILITAVVIIVGLVCIWESGNSFGSSFSAILRTTRNTDLDAIVPARETQGIFPMSKQLGMTRVILQRQVSEAETRTAFTIVDTPCHGREERKGTELVAIRRMSFDSLLQSSEVAH